MRKCFGFSMLASFLGIAGGVQAALIPGVVQTSPDVTLGNTYLIYDWNGVNSTTGLLKVVSFNSTLNEGPGAGGSTLTQLYTGGGDTTPDLMMTIAIDNSSGNFVSSSAHDKVTITFGNSVIPNGPGNTPGFKWLGDVTEFGWQQNVGSNPPYEYGTVFNGRWKFTLDDYEDMPTNMSQFVDGVLTSAMVHYHGGYIISNSTGFGTVAHPTAFQRDWVFGLNANNSSLQSFLNAGGFLTGLSSTTCMSVTQIDCKSFVHSTVLADVFVPIPPAFWLWGCALGATAPLIRRAHVTLQQG